MKGAPGEMKSSQIEREQQRPKVPLLSVVWLLFDSGRLDFTWGNFMQGQKRHGNGRQERAFTQIGTHSSTESTHPQTDTNTRFETRLEVTRRPRRDQADPFCLSCHNYNNFQGNN